MVSAPLTLSLDLTDKAAVDESWPIIANKEALDVNQDWAGFSGSLFKQSQELIGLTPCRGTSAPSECMFPTEQYWYKPLSGHDARQSVVAVLLMNNDASPRNLSFAFNEVPSLKAQASTSFSLFDIWAEKTIVVSQYGGFEAKAVPSHGSVFLKISTTPV